MNPLLRWFAANSVVANLMMIVILAAGLITVNTITKEVFPEFSLDMVTVSVIYRGAAPEEVEEGVCVKIEEAIQDLEGIKRITSSSSEGMGSVLVELEPGTDVREMLNDVKTRVDAISTFPDETEKPVIAEVTNRRQVIDIAVSGAVSETVLKEVADRVRDELQGAGDITQVEVVAARPYEISIEVSEEALRRYDITFDFVAAAIRRSSLDLPGGSIRTAGGEILLRTKGQAYRGADFDNIVLMTRPDGTRLLLGDVARVVDGFAETDQSARFSGEPAVLVRVYRVGDQNALDIARDVKAYVSEAQARMPAGVALTAWNDYSRILRGRLNLLITNAIQGFILVFIILALFLRLRLAFWVSLGIPISFLGALWLMPSLGLTINMLSLFAFVVVLGMVVDDAIVVGENIYDRMEQGEHGVDAAARGATEVAVPVTFAILTTVCSFMPLMMVQGTTGKFMRVIPIIVIATLVFSWIESLFILPAHIAHSRPDTGEARNPVNRAWKRFQKRCADGLDTVARKFYAPGLRIALKFRYGTVALALAVMLITIGIVGAGWIKFRFFPDVESDFVAASVTMPPGVSVESTADAVARLEENALALRDQLEAGLRPGAPSPIQHIFTAVGDQPYRARQSGPGGGGSLAASNVGEVLLELAPAEKRRVTSSEVARRWRESTGQIPDAIELSFSATIFSAGDPINVQLAGLDLDRLEAAAGSIKEALTHYEGVFDISDSFRGGKQEIKLTVKPAAEAYGITLSDLGRQVRQAFYGEEAQRIQRGRDDVRIMVRFPEAERRSIADLERMRIRTPDGGEVPFTEVAKADLGAGFSTIQRVDRKRTINVTADVDPTRANASEINRDLKERVLPGILKNYPSVSYSFEGEQREQADTMGDLGRAFLLAQLLIFAQLAIVFRSYIQPLIVMSVIPFGLVGAVWGHIVMGIDLSIMSVFGLVAVTGVVVNDSIVLVDYINRKRREGLPMEQALREAGIRRFRPIWLTSLTTFAGLTPLLLARSVQAKFMVPMAVSLAFGVVGATFITLGLVPAGYLILEDVKRGVLRLSGKAPVATTAGAVRTDEA
ncbi:MAG: efflux RND transporter permease subunit [Candidatus Krumholzibacteria bacterium]|nr:efflux RND transporter permease subunit [Candidatus Krumholzibacteria bacterium]MDH4337806.1 efflux RND transporter permease subunit [Candidatus Krumholzibacteria bacterium]MDH5271156.1 efflux RND transporter permease subunit [Candidatus Krumholzibacteria bacterium]